MNLPDLLELCAKSSRSDWNLVGPGATYLNYFGVSGAGDERSVLGQTEHAFRAVYIPDIDIAFAYGLNKSEAFGSPEPFDEEWTRVGADSRPGHRSTVDFLYRGQVVNREDYVLIDGMRCSLPIPQRRDDEWTITRWQYDFFKLLDGLEGASDFDMYIHMAKFRVV